jgi:hypothetical protein
MENFELWPTPAADDDDDVDLNERVRVGIGRKISGYSLSIPAASNLFEFRSCEST